MPTDPNDDRPDYALMRAAAALANRAQARCDEIDELRHEAHRLTAETTDLRNQAAEKKRADRPPLP